MWPDATSNNVLVLGCPNSVDWWVEHRGQQVQLTAPDGETVLLYFDAYRARVLAFADEFEAFYQRSAPKKVPADAPDAEGYELLWNEWHGRRNQWPR